MRSGETFCIRMLTVRLLMGWKRLRVRIRLMENGDLKGGKCSA